MNVSKAVVHESPTYNPKSAQGTGRSVRPQDLVAEALRPSDQETDVSPKKRLVVANTIDEKHTEMLQYFDTIETETIPQLIQTIQTYKADAKVFANTKRLEQYLDVIDKIEQTKKQIVSLRSKKKKYLLECSKYIFQYFEQKKNISEGGGIQNVNLLNSFFKIKATHSDAADIRHTKYQT